MTACPEVVSVSSPWIRTRVEQPSCTGVIINGWGRGCALLARRRVRATIPYISGRAVRGLGDDAVLTVPVDDFLEPVPGLHRPAGGPRGDIAVGEGVRDRAGGSTELGELVGQPTVVGFDVCAAVVRDQAGKLCNPRPRRYTAPSSGWKPGVHQRFGVADVVQVRGHDQQVPVGWPVTGCDPFRVPGDFLRVRPFLRQLDRE